MEELKYLLKIHYLGVIGDVVLDFALCVLTPSVSKELKYLLELYEEGQISAVALDSSLRVLRRVLRRVLGSCEEKHKGVGEDDEPTKDESYEGPTKDESYDDPWCMPNFHDKPTPIKTSAPKHVKNCLRLELHDWRYLRLGSQVGMHGILYFFASPSFS